jgi:hypothetical protein
LGVLENKRKFLGDRVVRNFAEHFAISAIDMGFFGLTGSG